MYAYAEVIVERPGVRALPLAALTHRGDQASYWKYEDGKAVQTEIETGISDGQWIEVTHRRVPASRTAPAGKRPWTSIDGSEQVILGDLSILTEGAPVQEGTAISKHQRADATIVGQFHVAVSGTIVELGQEARPIPSPAIHLFTQTTWPSSGKRNPHVDRDYTCTFSKRERIKGQLTPLHVIMMKARTQPRSIYLDFNVSNGNYAFGRF